MMKVEGFDEFRKDLDKLAQNVAALDGQHDVPIDELLTPTFLLKHTRFSSTDELFEQSGFKIESPEDFEAIPDEEWDNYIRSISNFNDWEAMLSKAGEIWITEKIGL
ncbi:MAG: hypothetical protein H6867_03690 [Rhodospirillales bacterium]|nr:hypothetical protein [Rhodospirillales bacterium]MCB9996254.1 hypothetical protein [Rhodospirillales bacterium]